MTENFKRKALALVLCFATVLTSINTMAFTNVYAATAGAHTSKTWADIGDSNLNWENGTASPCTTYLMDALNKWYGLDTECPDGYVSNQKNWLESNAERIGTGNSDNINTGQLKAGDILVFNKAYTPNDDGYWTHVAILGGDGLLHHGGIGTSGSVVHKYSVYDFLHQTSSAKESHSYIAYRLLADKGKGCIKKSIDPSYQSLDYLASCSTYSLAGAQYGVYSSSTEASFDTNRLATLTTDANGNTGTTEQFPGTYYIKELKASPGYKLDGDVHQVTISAGSTSTWQVYEKPADDPIQMFIKQNKSDPGSTKNLEGALFTVKYYDVDSSVYTTTDSVAGLTPNRSWTFKTAKITDESSSEYGKVVAYFNDGTISSRPDCLVRNETIDGVTYTSDDLYHSIYGDPTIPVGVFTIEETLAPSTFAKDDTVLYGKVYMENGTVKEKITGTNENFTVNAEFSATTTKDDYQRVSISVEKKDSETKTSVAQGY